MKILENPINFRMTCITYLISESRQKEILFHWLGILSMALEVEKAAMLVLTFQGSHNFISSSHLNDKSTSKSISSQWSPSLTTSHTSAATPFSSTACWRCSYHDFRNTSGSTSSAPAARQVTPGKAATGSLQQHLNVAHSRKSTYVGNTARQAVTPPAGGYVAFKSSRKSAQTKSFSGGIP